MTGGAIQRNPATSATQLTTSRTSSAHGARPPGVQTIVAAPGKTVKEVVGKHPHLIPHRKVGQ